MAESFRLSPDGRVKAAEPPPGAAAVYILKLNVAGASPRSARATANIRRICEEHLEGRHELQVFDICLHPELAQGAQILAAPTLVRQCPLPVRRFVGDMSSTAGVLHGLDLDDATVKAAGAGGR